MAITTRQTNLLVNQDWKLVYQSFKEADFQSYDFETLRKSMIDYLRTYYPEDFNDFTESSEYIALIDLIAFLGQGLAFRTDLNARENFFDTAERRDSILKLARLISYNGKRNVPASGLLKIDSISTTEPVTDSNGIDLSNIIVHWNDSSNPDWLEQFTTILNSALISNQVVGNPGNSSVIAGIKTDEYSINLVPDVIPTYSYKATIDGNSMVFEAVSSSTIGKEYIYEVDPTPNGKFNILFRNDNLGNSSNNTGYFVQFKQGKLNFIDFVLKQSLPNRTVNVNISNINNTDTWLYQLDSNKRVVEKWEQVPALAGVNVIYNKNANRNLYQVNSKTNDQVDLIFGDGSFSSIPHGSFRFYYRTSNGMRYKISPDEMQNITIPISYVTRDNRVETLTIRASLNYTVANAEMRESVNDIRIKAPQQYYTQNRMVNGEDYNIFPYVNFSNILKVKTVNRSSSGISRYLDVLDSTGKYSSTNVFCSDGWLYKESEVSSSTFTFSNTSDVNNVIYNVLQPILSSTEIKHFYYDNFPRYTVSNITWFPETLPVTEISDGGFFVQGNGNVPQDVGVVTDDNLKYVTIGAMIKFDAPVGYYFDARNNLKSGSPQFENDRHYIWTTVQNVESGNYVRLNEYIPRGAVVGEIMPTFKNTLPSRQFVDQIAELILSYKNFGIRYDTVEQRWVIILPQDLKLGDFDITHEGDQSGTGQDSSWIMSFYYNGASYTFSYRNVRYVFESLNQTRFFFDSKTKVYDSKVGKTIDDHIKVLKINNKPDTSDKLHRDQTWKIYNSVMEVDGYENATKVYVTFPDNDHDGIPDDIDLFKYIVEPSVNSNTKFVFFKEALTGDQYPTYVPIDSELVVTEYATEDDIRLNWHLYLNDQLFYAYSENKFFALRIDSNLSRSLELQTQYISRVGRQKLYFQYRHNSPNDRRIDPSPNNIMDMYILTKQYSEDYLTWIRDTSNTVEEPKEPTSEELKLAYGTGINSLENYKAKSDTIVYNSGRYKPVFGSKAAPELRATFKVVKNPNTNVSDNDIKSSVIAAINQFFDTDNWDFGETFYFSELSTYLHNSLAPNIASIVIVPTNNNIPYGSLMQINAEPDEVIVSAATVDNVEIITAVTAAQLKEVTTGNIV